MKARVSTIPVFWRLVADFTGVRRCDALNGGSSVGVRFRRDLVFAASNPINMG